MFGYLDYLDRKLLFRMPAKNRPYVGERARGILENQENRDVSHVSQFSCKTDGSVRTLPDRPDRGKITNPSGSFNLPGHHR